MVKGIVKLNGIWFAGGKFGMNWELVQLKFTPRSAITSYSFVDDDDDEDEEEKGQNYVLDSEDEGDL